MSQIAISGIILTHNSEQHIEKAVFSMMPLIQELIIMDDQSTDNTIKIIQKLYPQARVFTRPLNDDFSAQRNAAMSQAKHNWILMIDSDEAVTKALQSDIIQTLKKPKREAYISRRDNQAFDYWTRSTSGRPILLKRHLVFTGTVHERVKDTAIGYLSSSLRHYSWDGFSDFCEEMAKYSKWHAQSWINKGIKLSPPLLLLRSMISFPIISFKIFFFEGKWRMGFLGVLYSLALASDYLLTPLFYYEMVHQKPVKTDLID